MNALNQPQGPKDNRNKPDDHPNTEPSKKNPINPKEDAPPKSK